MDGECPCQSRIVCGALSLLVKTEEFHGRSKSWKFLRLESSVIAQQRMADEEELIEQGDEEATEQLDGENPEDGENIAEDGEPKPEEEGEKEPPPPPKDPYAFDEKPLAVWEKFQEAMKEEGADANEIKTGLVEEFQLSINQINKIVQCGVCFVWKSHFDLVLNRL